jgi:hypothetical protein
MHFFLGNFPMADPIAVMRGAAAFGVKLDVADGTLVYNAKHHSPAILEKIAEHEEEIVAVLKPRKDAVASLWPTLADLDAREFELLRAEKAEEIARLQAVLNAMDSAAAVILPLLQTDPRPFKGDNPKWVWGCVVKYLLDQYQNRKHEHLRPRYYSDEQWLSALHKARALGYNDGPVPPRKLSGDRA